MDKTLEPALKRRRDAHDSASLHVNGKARYVDDRLPSTRELYVCVGGSDFARAKISAINLDAVREAAEVVDVITADDIPGVRDIGPVFPGDPLLAEARAEFHGQAIFAVAARTQNAARRAARLAQIEYDEIVPPVLDARVALEEQIFVRPTHQMQKGETQTALQQAPNRVEGELRIGGQEHLYLEGQVALAEPQDHGGVVVYTSSQHPSEVQALVAKVLNLDYNRVRVEVRRMGGGFGGKETQAAAWACICALFAVRNQCPVRMRLPRSDDMRLTGKRHPFYARYKAGFDNNGVLQAVEHELSGACGYSPDLSDAIVDRAMFHADNAYFLPNALITGHRCKTDTVSHTAFRGFGGPQGMLAGEALMERIARQIGEDPLTIRKRNFYRNNSGQTTPYHQPVATFTVPQIVEQLEETSDYWQRRKAMTAFNKSSTVIKKGLALTPVKFGISFTAKHLNQAGALVHVYSDGSIHLNHGGTEMGQGLYIKIARLVADEFGVNISNVAVSAADTEKVPNTSPTAASSGTDINGQAALQAARTIKRRLAEFAATQYNTSQDSIHFKNDQVAIGEQTVPFAELVKNAYFERVSLSATGFYRTPEIHYNRETASGEPFYYYACGAAVSEVHLDTLTGEYRFPRVDILHDVGNSVNPAVDRGQIEGGFIQGLGWLTSEELVWDEDGRLLSNNPATYKIPAIGDTPEVFNVALLENTPNEKATVLRSKAVGEPPLMLAISAWCAIKDAIASVSDYRLDPDLDSPATPERVLFAVESIRSRCS